MEFKNDLIGKFLQILHFAIPLLRTKLPYWIDEVVKNWKTLEIEFLTQIMNKWKIYYAVNAYILLWIILSGVYKDFYFTHVCFLFWTS